MRLLITIIFAFGLSNGLLSQDFANVKDAFSKGNASDLGRALSNSIEYTSQGKTNTISKSDAENRLRSFFMDHEVRDFESMHKGVSQSDVHYMIGQLHTSKGAFRVTIYMHKDISDYVIQSIEIEKD
ncbi:MAG: DUF4783 domain-containing protein [Salibacteraceae bacterium]